MPRYTPGYVKNIIRRSFRELIEPSSDKKDVEKLWKFFDSSCVYCGCFLDRRTKKGRIDHLVPASQGGTNHISNYVLSCADCNDKEKLDLSWEAFLERKVSDAKTLLKRRDKILLWQKQNRPAPGTENPQLLGETNSRAEEVIEFYSRKVMEVRKLRGSGFRI